MFLTLIYLTVGNMVNLYINVGLYTLDAEHPNKHLSICICHKTIIALFVYCMYVIYVY